MSDIQLTTGEPVPSDGSHKEIEPSTGMQKGYVVLSPEERAKGFVKPVRRSYIHKKCGAVTTMGVALAETYARDPHFYSGTFCVGCHTHFPLDEFVWDPDGEPMKPSLQEAWHKERAQIKEARRLQRIAELTQELAELEGECFKFHFEGKRFSSPRSSMTAGELLSLVDGDRTGIVFEELNNKRVHYAHAQVVDLTREPWFFIQLPVTPVATR